MKSALARPDIAPAPTIGDLVERFGGVPFGASGDRALDSSDDRLAQRLTDLHVHSGSVKPGDAFAALPGLRADGARFVPDALGRGAALVLTSPTRTLDSLRPNRPGDSSEHGVIWLHPRARQIAGHVADEIHGHPSAHIAVAGVTGTNGKTSVVHLTSQLLGQAGRSAAILGTAGHVIAGPSGRLSLDAINTTPDATEIHRLLARHRAGGGDAAAMEVSSHGLTLGRLTGVRLRAAAFTNLTREHLDFHRTMDRYLRAKAKIWEHVTSGGAAIVFGDSAASEAMAEAARARGLRVVRVRVSDEVADDDGLTARIVRNNAAGVTFDLFGLGLDRRDVRLPLRGQHNVENALVAAALARALGADPSDVLAGIERVVAAPGRLEPVTSAGADTEFEVLVDYAHSPDALERVLAALRFDLEAREKPGGRLICVFGCGGDRDTGKREPMGRAAGRLADVSIVTSDNPRSEDPALIADAVARGVDEAAGRRVVELDRRAAIERAVEIARPGDVVLIAGKGHENTQVGRDGSIPFDDRVVATEALERRIAGGAR